MSAEAKVLLTGDDTALQRAFASAGMSAAKFGAVVAAGAAVAYQGMRQLAGFLQHAVKEASEAETAVARLRGALGGGDDAAKTASQLQSFASAIQSTTKFSDDFVIALYAQAAGMGIAHDQIAQTTNAAIALSSATGGSMGVEQAMRALIRATEADEMALKRFVPALAGARNEAERSAAITAALARGQQVLSAETDTFAGRMAILGNAVNEAAEAVGGQLLPYVSALAEWFVESLPAITGWTQAIIDGFGAIVSGVAPVFTWLGSAWSAVRDAAVAAAATATVVWENLGDTMQIAGDTIALTFVGAYEDVKHFFGTAVPAYLGWFAENWFEVFETAGNLVASVFSNMAKNIYEFFAAVAGWFAGDEFSFEWTALTEGFENTMRALPEIADRQSTALERSLTTRMDRIGSRLGRQISDAVATALGETIAGPETPDAPMIGGGLPGGLSIDTKEKAGKTRKAKGGDSEGAAGQVIAVEALWARISGAASKPEQRSADATAAATEKTAANTRELLGVAQDQSDALGRIASGIDGLRGGVPVVLG